MTDNKLIVSLNNQDVTISVKDIITNPINNQDYLIYTLDNIKDGELMASKVIEEGDTISLDAIDNNEEYTFVEDELKKRYLSSLE